MLPRAIVAPWLFIVAVTHIYAETAYLVPSMQVDYNPYNNSIARLADVFTRDSIKRYDTVLLTEDFNIDPTRWPETEPIRLVQNLTISSTNFFQGLANYKILNTEFLESRIIVPENVTVTLRDLVLARARKTSGQGLPFFVGDGEQSVVLLENVLRLRDVCAPNASDLVEGLRSAPRPVNISAANATNDVTLVEFTFRGELYTNCVHAEDTLAYVSSGEVDRDIATKYGGYTIHQTNTTRLCDSYVSAACVASKGADECIVEQTNVIVAAANARSAPTVNVAAIVAPVVIGVALIGTVAAFLLLCRQRRQRTDKSQQQQALMSMGSAAAFNNSQDLPSDPRDLPGAHGGAAGTLETLAVGNRGGGWKLMACHTSPEFKDATPNDRIKLGLLLGAGSFGRVYKGYWHHMEVAVKVLQHDSTTAAAISNEVDLVMSFRHPNIVAAYHFVTWTQSGSEIGSAADQPGQTLPPGAGSSSGVTQQQQQQQNIPALQAATATQNGRGGWLKTVIECTSSSSGLKYSSFPKPPGIVLSSRDGNSSGSGSHAGFQSSASNVSQVLSGGANMPGSAGASKQPGAGQDLAADPINFSPTLFTPPSVGSRSVAPAALSDTTGGGGTITGSLAASSGIHTLSGTLVGLHGSAHLGYLPASGVASTVAHAAASGAAAHNSSAAEELQHSFTLPSVRSGAKPAVQPADVNDTLKSACAIQIIPFTPAQLHGHERQVLSGSGLSTLTNNTTVFQHLDMEQGQAQSQLLEGYAAAFNSAVGATSMCHNSNDVAGRQSIGDVCTTKVIDAGGTGCKRGAAGGRARLSTGAQPAEAQTWLILEYCNGGTLLDLLQDGLLESKTTIGCRNMAHVLTLLADVASGMAYLHSRNVLHGDLKPGNVLIKHQQGAPYGRVAKVSDFGLSRALQVGQSHRSTRTMGTMNHTPPELLRLGRLSPAGDVYAFGILMWEVYTGQVAFAGLHYGEVFEQVALWQKRPPVPEDMSEDYAALMMECWAADPFSRPSFTSVQQRLQGMLDTLIQGEKDASERFVSDL